VRVRIKNLGNNVYAKPALKAPFKSTGLTLIELLLAMAILGVLVAIALPKYYDYRERVKQAQAVQDIAALQLLIQNYRLNVGTYPAALADVGNGSKLDPWGRAYVYVDLTSINGKGMARKDRKLNPINSDFDLYSVGKDGTSKTQLTNKESLDDVVRASDGAFIGLAANYTH